MLVALVYFGRVVLAKRRERIRRLKDPDFEGNEQQLSATQKAAPAVVLTNNWRMMRTMMP